MALSGMFPKIGKGGTVAIVGCGGVGVNARQGPPALPVPLLLRRLIQVTLKQAISRQLGATDFVRLAEDADYEKARAVTDDTGYDAVLVAVDLHL